MQFLIISSLLSFEFFVRMDIGVDHQFSFIKFHTKLKELRAFEPVIFHFLPIVLRRQLFQEINLDK